VIFNVRDREQNAEIWRALRTLSCDFDKILNRLQDCRSLAAILGTYKRLISSTFFFIFLKLHDISPFFLRPRLSFTFLHISCMATLAVQWQNKQPWHHNYCLYHQYSQKTIRIVGKINYERKQNYLATIKHKLTFKNF
jgi:hypothetical protein